MKNPLQSLTHRERAGLAVAVGVLVLFGIGSATYRAQTIPLQPTTLPVLAPVATHSPVPISTPAPALPPSAPLVVYVSGAVKKPGVYSFPRGQRLFQAVRKAGGFTQAARQDALNLAAFLKDAEQVHVPKQLEPEHRLVQNTPQSKLETSQTPHKLSTPTEGKIALNAATLEELQRLPGVGPSTAESILEYRKTKGGFQELEQLKDVQGIGEKKFARMEPFLKL